MWSLVSETQIILYSPRMTSWKEEEEKKRSVPGLCCVLMESRVNKWQLSRGYETKGKGGPPLALQRLLQSV